MVTERTPEEDLKWRRINAYFYVKDLFELTEKGSAWIPDEVLFWIEDVMRAHGNPPGRKSTRES